MTNVIDGFPESFGISPIRTHGLHAENIHKQIQYKLEILGEKIDVKFINNLPRTYVESISLKLDYCLFVRLFVCLFVCLFICLFFVCLFVCLFVHQVIDVKDRGEKAHLQFR